MYHTNPRFEAEMAYHQSTAFYLDSLQTACDTFCVGETISANALTEGLQSMATGWAPDRYRFSTSAEKPTELGASKFPLFSGGVVEGEGKGEGSLYSY